MPTLGEINYVLKATADKFNTQMKGATAEVDKFRQAAERKPAGGGIISEFGKSSALTSGGVIAAIQAIAMWTDKLGRDMRDAAERSRELGGSMLELTKGLPIIGGLFASGGSLADGVFDVSAELARMAGYSEDLARGMESSATAAQRYADEVERAVAADEKNRQAIADRRTSRNFFDQTIERANEAIDPLGLNDFDRRRLEASKAWRAQVEQIEAREKATGVTIESRQAREAVESQRLAAYKRIAEEEQQARLDQRIESELEGVNRQADLRDQMMEMEAARLKTIREQREAEFARRQPPAIPTGPVGTAFAGSSEAVRVIQGARSAQEALQRENNRLLKQLNETIKKRETIEIRPLNIA